MPSEEAPRRPGDKLDLGPLNFDCDGRKLVGPAGQVRLQPRVAMALTCLHHHAGEVVTREALFSAIWPRGIVGDDSLNRLIAGLRRSLIDVGACEAVAIETVPRTGYRLTVAQAGGVPEAHAALRFARRPLLVGSAALFLGTGGLWWRSEEQASSARVTNALATAEIEWERLDSAPFGHTAEELGDLFRADPSNRKLAGAFAIAAAENLVFLGHDPTALARLRQNVAVAASLASPQDALTAKAIEGWTGDNWHALESTLRAAPTGRHVQAQQLSLLASVGRLREAKSIARAMLEQNPASHRRIVHAAGIELLAGDYLSAEHRLEQAARYFPADSTIWKQRFIALSAMGRHREALDRFVTRIPGVAEQAMPPSAIDAWDTTLRALADPSPDLRKQAVERALAAPRDHFSASPNSLVQLALLGEESRLIALAKSYYTLEFGLVRKPRVPLRFPLVSRAMPLLWDARMAAIRRAPEFAAIAEACGFTRYWRAGGAWPDDRRAANLALRELRIGKQAACSAPCGGTIVLPFDR